MPHRSRLGRAVALALGVLLVVAASPVQAAKSQRSTDHSIGLDCPGATYYLDLFSSEIDGLFGDLDIWVGSSVPFQDPADFHRDYDQPLTGTVTATGASVTFTMVDSTGAPAPSASVTASYAPTGPAEPFTDRFRDGNAWFQQSGSDTPLAVTASVTFGGTTLPAPDCTGFASTVSTFTTNPHAAVRHTADRFVACSLEDAAGNTGHLFVSVDETGTSAFVDASLDLPNEQFRDAAGELPIAGNGISGSLEVYDSATNSILPDPATIVGQVSQDGIDADYTLRAGSGRQRNQVVVYAVSGTVTFPGGPSFDLGGCLFQDVHRKSIANVPSSKLKSGGKTPVNDAPSGALALAVPGTATAQTGGAHDSEVPYPCLLDETGQPIPVFRTVWYRVTGTGGTITVDTAGSAFDTIVAVYTASGGGYLPVADACVEDVLVDPVGRTLQAAVSWPTTAGVTYYVQIGGFPDDVNWGTLKVRAS